MPLSPEQRRILAPLLELYALDREPASFAAWIQTNELATALAHLVATDGNASFLLRCLASGVLRVAVEDSGARALALSTAGRAGVNVRDAETDANALAIAAGGFAKIENRDRDGSLCAVLTWPEYGMHTSGAGFEHAHGGAGVETHDFTTAFSQGLVITVAAGPVHCYRSTSSGGCEFPIGIATPGPPLVTATAYRYLDFDTTAAGKIHVLSFATEQES